MFALSHNHAAGCAHSSKKFSKARLQIQVLEARLRLVRIAKYGPRSEDQREARAISALNHSEVMIGDKAAAEYAKLQQLGFIQVLPQTSST